MERNARKNAKKKNKIMQCMKTNSHVAHSGNVLATG